MWEILSSAGPGARAWNQVTYDGRPLLAGGATGGGRYSNDVWTIENGQWREIIPHNGSAEPVSREHHSFSFCPKDGKSYFWQGHTGSSANSWATDEQRRKIWRFDSQAEVWEDTGAVLPPGQGLKMSAGTDWCPPLDGFLTAGGGNLSWSGTYLLRYSDMQQVQLATNGVSPGGPDGKIRMNVNNQGRWLGTLNRFAIYGGQDASSTGANSLGDLKLFIPETLTWYDQPIVNRPPSRTMGAIAADDRHLYIIAGTNAVAGVATRLKDFWRIDLSTWEAERLPDLPFTYYFHGAVIHEGKVIVYGGFCSEATANSGKVLAYPIEDPPMLTTKEEALAGLDIAKRYIEGN